MEFVRGVPLTDHAAPLVEKCVEGNAPRFGPAHTGTGDAHALAVPLYESWDKAEPGKAHDAEAAAWKAKLDALDRSPATGALTGPEQRTDRRQSGSRKPELSFAVYWAVASVIIVVSLAGVALTLVTLPGAWLIIGAGIACNFWVRGTFDWWTIVACAVLGVMGEVLEFAAGAAGAAKAGGTRRGAWGGIIGSLVGAIAGSMVLLFPIGTILGAVVGAGVGAALMERTHKHQTWETSAKVGTGAAIGRFAATIIKTAITLAIGATLSVAAFVK